MSKTATDCVIALGGNQGSVEQTFELALRHLEQAGCRVGTRSRIIRSAPMGASAGDEFTNAVVLLSTDREPLDLLDLLQATEEACGRQRGMHWGPRTLDLDLLFFGQEVIRHPRLTVPHPGLWYRRFVLDPLVEIAPDIVHPGNGRTVRELWDRLQRRPLVIAVEGMESMPSEGRIRDSPEVQIDVVGTAAEPTPEQETVFCCVRADSSADKLPGPWNVDSERFQIVVHPVDVPELLSALLAAALGDQTSTAEG